MVAQKFGARQPTGTPSLGWSSVVVIVSLLAGASIVHNLYKPNLSGSMRYDPMSPLLAGFQDDFIFVITLPPVENVHKGNEAITSNHKS